MISLAFHELPPPSTTFHQVRSLRMAAEQESSVGHKAVEGLKAQVEQLQRVLGEQVIGRDPP